MKQRILTSLVSLVLAGQAWAQGTAFTYQGRLAENSVPANGAYDLTFTLFDAASGGAELAINTLGAVGLTNGLFTVTLDFENQFLGADRWLQVAARPAGGGAYTALAPRQKVAATPYAITAGNVIGPVPAGQLFGTLPLWVLPDAVVINSASGQYAIALGYETSASGRASIALGEETRASGYASTAMGSFASAGHDGAFVWADAQLDNFATTGANQFLIRAGGGVGINTNNPGTAALAVHGRVGIGEINPAAKLVVRGDGSTIAGIAGYSPNNQSAIYGENTSGIGGIGVAGRNHGPGYGVYGDNNNPAGWAGYFTTRLHVGGDVGIGTTTPGARLHVVAGTGGNGIIATCNSSSTTAVYGNNTSSGGFGVTGVAADSGTAVLGSNPSANGWAGYFDGRVYASGNVGIGTTTPSANLHVVGTAGNNTGVWSALSDRRLKENIAPMESGSLDRLLQLQGVTYDYAQPELREGYAGAHRGWIAQEVEKVFPEWVSETAEGMKMLTPVGFNALAVEALRELRAEKDRAVNKLEAENAGLKQELAEIKRLLETLAVKGNRIP